MAYKKDDSQIQKNQEIRDWIKSYIESLIDELHPQGDVLEVGFDIGQAANRIQSHHPKSHTIIESDPHTAENAKTWANDHKNVRIIQDSWQVALGGLGTFDAIFFNDSSQDCEMQLMIRQNPQETSNASAKAKELLTMLEEQLSQITVCFSDREIDDFYEKVGKFNLKELPLFLSKLKEKKHISEQQYKNTMKKYGIGEEIKKDKSADFKQDPSPMLLFLDECLEKHMRKGSRFSCFLTDTISKYEDSLFFDRIITNTNVDYREKSINVQVPNCKLEEALIITVEKT